MNELVAYVRVFDTARLDNFGFNGVSSPFSSVSGVGGNRLPVDLILTSRRVTTVSNVTQVNRNIAKLKQ